MSFARFVAATNDNSVIPEYIARGHYRPRPSVATISSAMDVAGLAVGPGGSSEGDTAGPHAQGVVLATAHPAKFAETVEPLIGRALPVPPEIASVMGRPLRSIPIAPELRALREVLDGTRAACARERDA